MSDELEPIVLDPALLNRKALVYFRETFGPRASEWPDQVKQPPQEVILLVFSQSGKYVKVQRSNYAGSGDWLRRQDVAVVDFVDPAPKVNGNG